MQATVGLDERFVGERVVLRCVTESDCHEHYLGWLEDPEVNRYLETRHTRQSLDTIRQFVVEMFHSEANHLFAILDAEDGLHVGNIKVGPVNGHHRFADVSYFIGERSRWGRGLASDAIRVVTRFGFERLELHRLQAGVYASNQGSSRALERAGYQLEGTFREALRSDEGWEDLHRFGILCEDWRP